MVIHDTECPNRDQVSLNNTNLNPNKKLHVGAADSLVYVSLLCIC